MNGFLVSAEVSLQLFYSPWFVLIIATCFVAPSTGVGGTAANRSNMRVQYSLASCSALNERDISCVGAHN